MSGASPAGKSPLADFPVQENIPELLNLDTVLTFGPYGESAVLTADDPSSCNLLSYAAGRGHREFRCLSRTHNPSSCVPCTDFSPWLRERVLRHEVEALCEYLWRVRRADPSVEGTGDQIQRQYTDLARAVMSAPLSQYLHDGTSEAYLDLRVTLVMLAAHETFSGFIMAGESADFAAAVMAPHALRINRATVLVERRNEFVRDMGQGMDYWACWAPLPLDAIRSPVPPSDAAFQSMLGALATLPLGSRAHAVDALRHLSADPGVPRTLASLSRLETRRRGLDVADSCRLILQSGLVIPAADAAAWLAGWTRRDLLGFLAQCGVRAPKSWSKERLSEMALKECPDRVRDRMAESGAVELAPAHAEAAGRLAGYILDVKETWRVWLGFGTGVEG
ncbi:MAG: hypothetical protein QOH59_1253 [Gemmatimonadales bacterium]|nr:hypothetical protein [Gemmatimonadales bacterium]